MEPFNLGTDPSGAPYDLDLRNSGSGWCGTFAGLISYAVQNILSDRESSEYTEVTLSDGTVLAGKLDVWQTDNDFTITEPGELPRIVEVDDVVRFRA